MLQTVHRALAISAFFIKYFHTSETPSLPEVDILDNVHVDEQLNKQELVFVAIAGHVCKMGVVGPNIRSLILTSKVASTNEVFEHSKGSTKS